MRISTLTNWAYAATLILTGLSGAAFISAAHSAQEERLAVEEHLRIDVIAEDLALGVEKLSDEARLYAMRRTARHRDSYVHQREVVGSLDGALERARAADPVAGERAAIDEAERQLVELERIEDAAVAAVAEGRTDLARSMLFGAEHERAQAAVLTALESFRALATARTETRMNAAHRASDLAGLVARITLGITALVFLAVLYFILRRRVALPLARMAGIVTKLADHDYDVDVPDDRRRDEIGEMAQAIQVFRQTGLERERLEAERLADQRVKDGILQMMHRLQACETRDELAGVVACFAPQTFPALAGALYVMDQGGNGLVRAADWLNPVQADAVFAATACWGLRRGRPHVSNAEAHDIACPHIHSGDAIGLCLPLHAQGETIGLLYLEERPEIEDSASRVFLDLMADNIALALANLRLRERLADLAVLDGLTGLKNRRALDQRLASLSEEEAVACVMIDIDHFKRFNDTFGHDAGDAVMTHVAQMMKETLGAAGEAYRFGGEEFTLVIPGASAADARAHAEALRLRISEAQLAHHGRMLGRISISLGVAAAPGDGPPATLLRQADGALLHAKQNGRDRTVLAGELSPDVQRQRA
ncbi:MAG TPA: diguanylate cyclase [Brevundimonas sp.]|jgi:diguanylate cyclase (GGDEF)-like protein